MPASTIFFNSRVIRKFLVAALLVLTASAAAFAADDYGTEVSTQPLGSPFFRHLAFDFGLDIRDMVKLERRGFGRTETVAIVLISKATGTNFKEYAKRRLKDKVLLKDLADEAKLDYPTLMKNAKAIKEGIEAKGDQNLPPPVFEASPTPEPRRNRKSRAGPSPSPSPSPLPTLPSPAPTPKP